MRFHNFQYSHKEWLYLRISFVLVWVYFAYPSYWNAGEISVPVGIAQYVPLTILLWTPVKILILFLTTFFLIRYIATEKQFIPSLVIGAVSLVIFTLEESSGVFNRVSLLTMVWFAQTLAIWIYMNDKECFHNRMIHFSIQVIAVAYMLSAVSKWSSSGLNWAADAKNLDLQILKGFYFHWTDNGDLNQIKKGEQVVEIIRSNQLAIEAVLWLSLIFESCAFLMLWNRKVTWIYGILLLSMHIGIYIVMGILILPVILPMLIFTINPLNLIFISWNKFRPLLQSK